MNFLLDTQAFLWLILDDARLPTRVREICKDTENGLYLSSVSVWEIGLKHGKGKLHLPEHPYHYLAERRALHSIESLSFDEMCAVHGSKLPFIHNDPFDRMLVCQAIQHGLAILTNDRMIQQYPIKTVW